MRIQRFSGLIAILAASALAITACGGSDAAQPMSTAAGTPEITENTPATIDPTPAAAPPQVGDCFDAAENFSWTTTATPVNCTPGAYTQRTLAVLDIPEALPISYPQRQELRDIVVEGGDLTTQQQADVDGFNDAISGVVSECSDIVNDVVLPGKQGQEVSMFFVDTTGPNAAQWDAGQRWLRCNISRYVLGGEPQELLPLPTQLQGAGFELDNRRCKVLEVGSNQPWEQCTDPTLGGTVLVNTNFIATTELRANAPKTVERAEELAAQFCETTQDPYTLPDRRGDIAVGWVLSHDTGADGTKTVLDSWDGARVYCIIDISDYTPTR